MSGVWAILLAAGAASRFGGLKALAEWGQGTLLSQALTTAQAVAGNNVITVLGGHADAIAPQINTGQTAINANWQQGLGTSIRTGMRAVMKQDPIASIAVILFVDQPLVTADHVNKLAEQAQRSRLCCLTQDGVVTGPPAAIPATQFGLLLGLSGDKGVKSVLTADDYDVIAATGMLADIDTKDDLQRLSQINR